MNRPADFTRRGFLRGTGIALSLPFLHSLLPRSVRAATTGRPPVRMGCLFFPNGVWRDSWIPKETGTEFTLPFSLEPLAPVKDSIVVVSHLDKRHSHQGDGHYAKTANFLTGLVVEKTTGKNISTGGISLDQLMAQHVGNQTPLPSLELGIDPVISGIDSNVGFTRLYGSNISWQTANRPVAKEINPRLVYERLFGLRNSGTQKGAASSSSEDRRKLLDLAMQDANDLRRTLGRDDQFKLDEYLDSVRAVERQVEFFQKTDAREWTPNVPESAYANVPQGIPGDYEAHVKLMLDLMVLAFWSDSTRVSTFMFANDVSGRNFSFVDGVKGSHHEMSHHEGKEEKIEQYRRINRWHVQQFANMLEQMRGIQEGEGTLLDHSMILLGCGFSDGNSHDPRNLPIILGGKGNGTLKTGQHLAPPVDTPLCNLYVNMLQQMDIPATSFGDSSGTLEGLV
ncbi:DUF1552 domain-containing protein [Planctomicrobium sp. SH661]|uniref:DUF1552 domain-containing protein n=1 Tax=Planctomicrobium sp. SH661 TaxID=3448124 RepID=UPI003F5BB855